mmetsp:Transcript_85868/g.199614  ORF Transcript_85868/g.199614 Transcript_85868/m.199614 type:complete len:253 (-) Transcript_85868:461-1219(-)
MEPLKIPRPHVVHLALCAIDSTLHSLNERSKRLVAYEVVVVHIVVMMRNHVEDHMEHLPEAFLVRGSLRFVGKLHGRTMRLGRCARDASVTRVKQKAQSFAPMEWLMARRELYRWEQLVRREGTEAATCDGADAKVTSSKVDLPLTAFFARHCHLHRAPCLDTRWAILAAELVLSLGTAVAGLACKAVKAHRVLHGAEQHLAIGVSRDCRSCGCRTANLGHQAYDHVRVVHAQDLHVETVLLAGSRCRELAQ